MWPYIIRVKPKGILIICTIFGVIFIFWYYLLIGSRDHLFNNSLSNLATIDLKKLLIGLILFVFFPFNSYPIMYCFHK